MAVCNEVPETLKEPTEHHVTNESAVSKDAPVATETNASRKVPEEKGPHTPEELSPTEDEEKNELDDIDDEEFDVDGSSPSNMLEFVKL